MKRFKYTALDHNGVKVSATIDAVSFSDARRRIQATGDRLIDLKNESKRNWAQFETRTRIQPGDAGEFALELSGLLSAGAPLRKALEIQASGKNVSSRLAASALRAINNGDTFSSGLRSAGTGADILAEFAEAGEAGAGLDTLMASAGKFLKARADASVKFRSALAYPIFILALAAIALSVITLYVAPALAPTLETSGQAGLVLFLADIGEWANSHLQFILLTLAALTLGAYFLMKRQAVKASLLRALWAAPMIGNIGKDLAAGQSCTILAALLSAGRSLESSLKYASQVSGPILSETYLAIAQRIRDGETASSAFNTATRLPLEVRRLAILGETTSAFPKAMQQAGEICYARAMRRLDRVSAMIGPVLVIGLGAAISLLMLGVLGSLSSIGETPL